MMMNDSCVAAVRIDQDLCSRCGVCFSLCPFEAILRDAEEGRLSIDIQKCQVCGICYSACPVSAIEMSYYDYEGLLDYVRKAHQELNSDALVMMCRGNSPGPDEIEEIMGRFGLEGMSYIPLRVPCAGRVPTSFFFNALQSGVRNIVSIQCNDEFCRMKEGTKIETRRMLLGKALLRQLGYPENTFNVVKYSRKAVLDTKECVGCDKCVFICPYQALVAEPFSSPSIITEKCLGCGACQTVCPQNAIHVKGYRFDDIMESYGAAASSMKARGARTTILVLSCQWSEYSALDNPERTLKERNAMILEIPCVKGMDPVHIVKALQQGFDGVMAVVCSPQDCKLQNGKDASDRQVEVLSTYLEKKGLIDRFEIHELSPRCEGDFLTRFEAFQKRIAAMPSSDPTAGKEGR
jgi:coenzyme F420-reducing hydrogenase delta subunit/ferredoxin